MSLLPMLTLWRREMVRFLRQRDRVMGAFLTPIVFWLLIGFGMGKSFQMPGTPAGHGYLQYFFAGTVVMILLFTAIFSTFSIIEDRREGFLQGVLVAPVGQTAIVVGKVFGGATLAVAQAVVFLALAPLTGLSLSLPGIVWLVLVMTLQAVALTALGFVVAWWMNSTAGYHAVMNVFMLPLWMLSGAVFPATNAPKVLAWVMMVNPVTYGVNSVRRGLYWNEPFVCGDWVALAVNIVFAVVMFVAALLVTRKSTAGDLH
jgi:ABC-2 type transport system permease protein